MIRRLRQSLGALLRAFDILLCAVWLSALYPLGLADRPYGRETISAYVGLAQHNGMAWGIRAAAVVDWLAQRVGEGPGHCHRAYEFYQMAMLMEG
ncbi:hypothetical protein EDF56_106313 [Novosphingobium sp. PhB165]|uniref:hypothetical protein n=1 Tax=Novosphingobium sp. PhB165 TaxID=2485105 RepID=UPI001042BD4C|nr:hypothetical protein [Novosphingobium sp. PhB165]TCM17197.1 hypothetical protein EDF56_106313 [Novosphingobium sp. PhB165]